MHIEHTNKIWNILAAIMRQLIPYITISISVFVSLKIHENLLQNVDINFVKGESISQRMDTGYCISYYMEIIDMNIHD